MRFPFLFILSLCIASFAHAQEGTDTLASFSDAEQEAEYQSFYVAEEDEETMGKAIVQGGSNGKVNTRPTNTNNNAPCKMWAILVADTYDENIGEDDAYDNLALNKELKAIAQCLGIEVSITNIKRDRRLNSLFAQLLGLVPPAGCSDAQQRLSASRFPRKTCEDL